MNRRLQQVTLAALVAVVLARPLPAAGAERGVADTAVINALEYRCIGPFRGGRSTAVAGVPLEPMTFYFGGTGGGVWKTLDGGQTWRNISDGFFGGSIGSVAVAASDRNVVYVGTGEKTVRGNVSHGDGIWKSVDAGKTWTHVGLKDSRHIMRLRIHPDDPQRVFAAALGHLFGPNDERGVFRSTDGGASWKRVLFVSREVGAADVAIDPVNPRVVYAGMWRVKRTPYSLESGGAGSSLWKSTDGGDSWKEITRNPGLPAGTVGIIGVAVSPVKRDRVWAIVEAEEGGVFRSDDGGVTWQKTNDDRNLRQRAWYYTRIYADPKNEEVAYVLNVQFWKSKDGGRTFESIDTPHGDHHDLWIDPAEPQRMAIADDGGAQVTFNGGGSWSTYENQPTAQFYRIVTDDHKPYRIYGAQQDNSTVRILSRSPWGVITDRQWEPTAGGESGWIAVDPRDNEVVYGGSYHGYLERYNHRTGETRIVNVWPENTMGHGAKAARYRFQWNFPILFSRHTPGLLYAAGNILFASTNEGQAWTPLGGDLTRNDTTKMESSGGPITKDNTSVEYYGTIFALAESPVEPGVLWAGSDDGLVHVTRDGGRTWANVTPRGMPAWIQVNALEAHPVRPGVAYLAATMYKSDDLRPYLYRTADYGRSWTAITTGIAADHFTRVVRADPRRQGLLYAGTERGVYVSFDDGDRWQPMQGNLPVVPVTDLAVKEDDLVVATQGRSFWVLDDLTPLHQLTTEVARADRHLFTPRPAVRTDAGWVDNPVTAGENPPAGVVIPYLLRAPVDSAATALRILDGNGRVIRTFTPGAKEAGDRMPVKRGMNRLVWNMRYPNAETFPGMIMWFGGTEGPMAAPGRYAARLVTGRDSVEVPVSIVKDPYSAASAEDLQAQLDFLLGVRDKLSETHRAIAGIRTTRSQVNAVANRLSDLPGHDSVRAAAKALNLELTAVEEALYQTKNKSSQDPLNYPVRLNNQLGTVGAVTGVGDRRPTDQAVAVRDEVVRKIDVQLARWRGLQERDVPAFNALVRRADIPAVTPDAGR